MFDINYEQKAKEIQEWIVKTVKNVGFSDVVIAVSGGVDSAVSLNLAAHALGKEHVYAVLLPHGELSRQSLEDGELVAASAGLSAGNIITRNITPVVGEILKQVQDDKTANDVRQGNMMARVRMIYLFDLAKQLSALVVGTENKSEHYLGYFTRFGDEASDIEPIRSLYKTQVWEMARYLGVPSKIIEKPPSAGLWVQQTDEGEFGFSYLDADKVLYYYFYEKLDREQILAKGLPFSLVDTVLAFVARNDFKHHVPYIKE